jgi:hypothetical protein
MIAATTMRNTQIHCMGKMQSSVIYTNSVRASQEKHYVSATKTNRLILFRETVAVYYENHTEHKYTVWQNAEFCNIYKSRSCLTGETYVSATKPNRLILFRETVAVYCANHTEHTNTLCGQNVQFYNMYTLSSYLKGNTCIRYKTQPVNAVWGNSRCLL